MARRRASKKKTTRRKPKFNALNAAQTYLQTAIVTQSAFNVSPIEFVTGYQSITRNKYNSSGQVIGLSTTTGYQPIANGTAITLPELFGRDMDNKAIGAGGYSIYGNGGLEAMTEAVRENIRLNGGYMKPIVQTAMLNIGFTIGKKVFRKQLSGVRKGLKMTGLSKDVTV
jgi:hypothetical protein